MSAVAAFTAVAAVVAASTVAAATASGTAAHPAAAHPRAAAFLAPEHVRGERITVTTTTCAPGWRPPNPGKDHFAVANRSGRSAVIYLFHPVTGRIVARIRHSRPHSVRELVVRLSPGTYMWGCDLAGMPPRNSEAEVVPRDPHHGGSGPPVVPVTPDQLAGPLRAYRAYVTGALRRLETQVAALSSAVADGSMQAARAAWLPAHLTWLQIGQDDGAYGIFGAMGRKIDGTAAGLVKGTSDRGFTGFHKIELDLWKRQDLAAAGADTAALAQSVRTLAREFPGITISLTDLPLRCHEILEDALRDTLSGADDYGSGTGFASVLADVAGTREILGVLASLITPRSPYLVHTARDQLNRLTAALAATRSGGRWIAVAKVSLTKREDVDGAIGAVLETLAPVPDLLRIGTS